jgi:4'-phosphopantetheinyl transferase
MLANLELPLGGVDVWQIHLAVREEEIHCCRSLLSEIEIERANCFRFPRDSSHFIVARSAMRKILSRYVKARPQDVVFSHNARGKPEFGSTFAGSEIKFNLSHSRDFAVLAVTQSLRVGVDIEFINHAIATDEVAALFFSQREMNTFLALSPGEKAEAFFACWTRKEAYAKALGEGMSLPLESFDLGFEPGAPAALSRSGGQEPQRWSTYDITADPGYAAALVVEGKEHRLRQVKWEPYF